MPYRTTSIGIRPVELRADYGALMRRAYLEFRSGNYERAATFARRAMNGCDGRVDREKAALLVIDASVMENTPGALLLALKVAKRFRLEEQRMTIEERMELNSANRFAAGIVILRRKTRTFPRREYVPVPRD